MLSKDNIKTLVSVLAAIIAGVSCFFSWQSLQSNEKVAKINTYMKLREEFNSIILSIPYSYYDENAPAPAKKDKVWKKISDYWYLSFDEWYVTEYIGNSKMKELWDERYKHVIVPALEKNAFRQVCCSLIEEKFKQNPLQKKYGKVLQSLYKEKHSKDLCPPNNK
ncbi:MAG: hypothetical protein WC855_06025 [Thermodesulfovibrionales bacterium]